MRTPYYPWLSIIFCYSFWIYHSVHFTAVSAQIVVEDQQSLLQLKNDLKFKYEKSRKLVTGTLAMMARLNLAINNFNSVIPSAFNKLNNLTYLNLSNAGFMGQIPIEISQLTRLVTLDISSIYYLNGIRLKLENPNLGKLVQNFKGIRQLYMDGVSVTAQGKEWCNALLHLQSLRELSMSNCDLSGPLDLSLISLKNLSLIRLNQNHLSSPIPEAFANFSNLTTLGLSYCGLTGIFPQRIFQLATLSEVDISFNHNLNGSFPEFPLHGSLRTLIVSNTRFSGAIPASISNLKQLSKLDLSNCDFNRTLPSSMSTLRELTYLQLSVNNFIGSIPSLNMSKNLIYLDLSYNYLTGSIASVHLEDLRELVQIDLQDNVLNGSIPSSLPALPLLQSIRLSNNNFQGQLHEFSNITSSKLEILDLSSNTLEGPIPTSISRLRSLSVLKLASNKLNGTIKLDVIQKLENLTTLDLSHNNLSIDTNITDVHLNPFHKMRTVELASCNLIQFPISLINQSRINTLDLSNNRISGSIPMWIWQLDSLVQLNLSHNLLGKLEGPVQNNNSFLKVLDLHSNQLQGKLPIFPVQVAYLDYSSNNFSSIIPSEAGTYLSSIIFLSLSKNNLSGSIPQSLCNYSNLLVLDVSYNHLQGKIPECLTEMATLVVLNLQNNKFDGNIPDTFPVSCPLRTLDLNMNLLEGPIPKSLANCASLEVLDLGNNQVDDEFPNFLKTISIRVMVLRGNKFHGPIRCNETDGDWHMLQIVDLASNNFSGSLPAKCFKTWKAMMFEEDHMVSNFNRIESQVLKYAGIYYQDSVTLTSKGLQMEFIKILTIFTSVDFSSNNFDGSIPEEIMNFTRLLVLNLSYNALTGQIPSSIGNLIQLESLDLSRNHLDGEIPTQLASLTFLSYLNLSFNSFVGKIPTGTQLQSFETASFIGNVELCGTPLIKKCPDPTDSKEVHTASGAKFDFAVHCDIVSAELGFIFGLGVVIGSLLFWNQWRQWYWKHVDFTLCRIFPQLNLEYERRGGHSYQVLRWRH
ncbi:hypothetical protein VNO77_20606 [Canavalia gladiata]|uniref:Receptor-like protein 12 n=1 Tax=Canavalia gladiata TaxID=3824 RepID=A0AAN9QLE4_CANGL